MARWHFVYYTADEIAQVLEDILRLRVTVDVQKRAVVAAREENRYHPKDFDNLDDLADYALEMKEASDRVKEEVTRLESVERDLEDRKQALRSVIPPGGSVKFTARDGTEYTVQHQKTSDPGRKGAIYFNGAGSRGPNKK